MTQLTSARVGQGSLRRGGAASSAVMSRASGAVASSSWSSDMGRSFYSCRRASIGRSEAARLAG